ncbi:MAG TPA: glycosyltransferase family 2 protein [Pyrinomonadaceae bacterium]|nr:glycosyltransferase family 2 protein [Pyrinomonadaceae bacterium]
MCTYNGGRYLREQLESISAQARTPDELVICDDRSADTTREVVESFAASAPFAVRFYVNEENLGSTKNFERAIGLCEGDVIALSDQDDVWHPDKLRRVEAALSDGRAGLAFTDGEVVDEQLRPLGWRTWQLIRFGEKELQQFEAGGAFDVLLDHNVVTGATLAFRAGFRDLVLPIPTDIVHDGHRVIHDGWIALLISAVAELAYVPELLIKYRQHPRQQLGVRSGLGAEGERRETGVLVPARNAARRSNSFDAEIHYLQTVLERLATRTDPARSRGARTKLEAALRHLCARAGMPEARLRRVPFVLRELLTLRYHRYSNGIRSAAKDLWL